jgi:hypothetical protein
VENRKDSEDTIGRLRGRMRILRMPFLCKHKEDRCVFRRCTPGSNSDGRNHCTPTDRSNIRCGGALEGETGVVARLNTNDKKFQFMRKMLGFPKSPYASATTARRIVDEEGTAKISIVNLRVAWNFQVERGHAIALGELQSALQATAVALEVSDDTVRHNKTRPTQGAPNVQTMLSKLGECSDVGDECTMCVSVCMPGKCCVFVPKLASCRQSFTCAWQCQWHQSPSPANHRARRESRYLVLFHGINDSGDGVCQHILRGPYSRANVYHLPSHGSLQDCFRAQESQYSISAVGRRFCEGVLRVQ